MAQLPPARRLQQAQTTWDCHQDFQAAPVPLVEPAPAAQLTPTDPTEPLVETVLQERLVVPAVLAALLRFQQRDQSHLEF